jgi:uncharacterized protein YndB with AHSA1/START domain
MSERSVEHATFTVKRTYEATPARVFAAWAEPAAKARWFGSGGNDEHELDFRIGGREWSRGSAPNGGTYTFEARYQDIVPDQRIVYAYEMQLEGTRISVSLGTVQLKPDGGGTQLTYTEQGAYLDGLDTPAQREQGTGGLFDALAEELRREPAKA